MTVICSGGCDRVTYPGQTQPNLTSKSMNVELKTYDSRYKCYKFMFEMAELKLTSENVKLNISSFQILIHNICSQQKPTRGELLFRERPVIAHLERLVAR